MESIRAVNAESKDTKSKSASEAFVNSFGSYPIGYGIGILILPLSVGWIREDPLVANLLISLIYAVVSFARSYLLRRTFERFGIEDNFLKLGIKLVVRIKSYFQSDRSCFYSK